MVTRFFIDTNNRRGALLFNCPVNYILYDVSHETYPTSNFKNLKILISFNGY